MKSLISLFAFVIASLFAFLALSCKAPIKEGELKGEVFVVTQGGQNIRLALVEVSAIPEDVISKFVAEKNSAIESEKENLKRQIVDFQRRADTSRKESDSAQNETERRKKASEVLGWLLRKMYSDTKLTSFPTAEYYFEKLPTGVAKAVTDSEGKFTLKLPDRKKYALAAKGERQIGDSKEEYCWLVWANLDGEASKTVMLSNHNLMTTQSSESLVLVKFMSPSAFMNAASQYLKENR